MGQEKKDFLILRSFDPPTNSLKIIKEMPKKYKGNIAISVFWALCKILLLENYFTDFLETCQNHKRKLFETVKNVLHILETC